MSNSTVSNSTVSNSTVSNSTTSESNKPADKEDASMPGDARQHGRVLITGANGNLGRRLISRLSGIAPVRAVVRSNAARQKLGSPVGQDLETLVMNYQDTEALKSAVADCETVVHLVGIIKESQQASYFTAHEQSTACLIEALAGSSVKRVIYISILGSHLDSPNSCLASKGRAEKLLMDCQIPALVLQVPMVLGEGDYASKSLLKRASSKVSFVLRGASLEQPIYAGDCIEAIIAGLNLSEKGDYSLQLAGPESLSRKALIMRTALLLKNKVTVVSLPLSLGLVVAFLLEKLSANPPVTRAMLGILDHDDAIDSSESCDLLGIKLTELDTMLSCLVD